MPRLHTGAAIDRPEVTHLTLPPIPEVVCQQPQETHSTNIHNDLTRKTHKHTHTPKHENDVEAQTSPIKETSFKYPDPTRNHSWKTKLGAYQYRPQ